MAAFHRPLLPKPQTGPEDRGTGPERPRGPRLATRRTPNTANACDHCRRRKVRCDGGHPKCSPCIKSGVVCTYAARQRRLQEVEAARNETILHLLRTVPHDEAVELLRALRANASRPDEGGAPNRTLTLSEQDVSRALLGLTQDGLEFELMVRHPVSYPALFPVQVASLPLEALLRPSRISVSHEQLDSSPSNQRLARFTVQQFPTRPLVDQRLREVEMKNWTGVSIDNDLAASIISFYIEIDYQTLPLFNLDLFLEDLIRNRPYFCSSLLVNALFSWACQAYTAINSEVHIMGQAFFDEAQRLIPDGAELSTLTSVAALQFLCIAALGYGQDLLGLQFLRQSTRMGVDMGLFGVSSELESATVWLDDDEEWIRAASYTAWGVYNWVSLYSLRYRSSEIDIPPKIPMPGTLNMGPESERLGTATTSVNVEVFKACCELWVISNNLLRRYSRGGGDGDRPSHQLAEQTFRQLLVWADVLPLTLVRSDKSVHAVMMMHIYFHVIVTDTFRPLLPMSQDSLRLHSFASSRATPRAVYAASINQLKRLLLTFRLSFKTASLSILSQTVLVYVCNAVVREAHNSNQSEWRFYLRLCLAASEDLYGCYRESWCVTRALLSMALERGALLPQEAGRLAQELLELGRHYTTGTEEANTRSVIDLDLAVTDRTAARVGCYAGKFEELMLEKSTEE